MKSKLFCLLLAVRVGLVLGHAADAPKTSDTLNTSYVEGVRLIADTNAAIERANRVLTIVEHGADGQAGRISEMEKRLQDVTWSANILETDSVRRVDEGKSLLSEKARLETRFKVLETALKDDRTLLICATKTVQALLDAADKSGKLAERRLADQVAAELKYGAEQVRLSSDRLAQIELRVTLETTLLQGLQARAGNEKEDIKALKAELKKLESQVAVQRTTVNKLTGFLNDDRSRLAQRQNSLGIAVEIFRVVQISVLRHWLIDGPPVGDMPSLTIDDVMEAGVGMDKFRRTQPSATGLGQDSAGLTERSEKARETVSSYAQSIDREPDSSASNEVILLYKKARWYLAMLSRLNSFAAQSLNEANEWSNEAQNWRNDLSSSGRTLADQRGALTSLTMEQGIVATTVELMTKQAATAREQVDGVVTQVEKQTKRLEEISADLKKQAEKI